MDAETLFEIEDLWHHFNDGTVGIREISLTIRAGEFIVLAGANGSGKTTFVRHLNGLLLPSRGRVRLAGIPVGSDLMRARQMVGMVFQDADSQIVGETVSDDVAFGPENLRLERNEIDRRTAEALNTVNLTALADQRPHLLSGGEKRRLAIAGILAMRPRAIIFDEPFASLDYPGVRQVLQQIVSLHGRGHTIVLITHDLEKVIAHAGRLMVMSCGRMVADGPPLALLPDLEKVGVRRPFSDRPGMEMTSWLN